MVGNQFNLEYIDKILDEAAKAGEEWATASALLQRYELGYKTKFNEVKNLVRNTMPPIGGKASWTQDTLEEATHNHLTWKDFLEDHKNAYSVMILAKVRYDSAKANFDALRSIMATQREELKVR